MKNLKLIAAGIITLVTAIGINYEKNKDPQPKIEKENLIDSGSLNNENNTDDLNDTSFYQFFEIMKEDSEFMNNL